MLAAIDSFWEYVSGRMETINPDRKMVGVSDAMDWPPKNVIFEGFYLLVLGQKPVLNKDFWSAAVPVVVHTLQFTWMILGTDINKGVVGRNRGTKYRTNMQMREELLKAVWPWWAQKQNWSVQGNTPSGISLIGTPTSPLENVWWTQPTFLNRQDKGGGVIYGAASVELTDMSEEITA